MNALSGLYGEALADLNDWAWLGACQQAIATCKFFPLPAELRELAEEHAERVVYERLATTQQQRVAQLEAAGQRMLDAGQLTSERVAENAEAFAELSAAARDAMRPPTDTPEPRDDFWSKEARDRVRRHRHLNGPKKGRR
jgi:hypothetical protein